MSEELTEEQKKTVSEALKNGGDNSNGAIQEDKKEAENYLDLARQLKAEQEKLIVERTKFEDEKREFAEIMKGSAQRGRSYAGIREPTDEEKVLIDAKKLLAGTGLNPFS